ncbi:hypothetical protein V6U90_32985 [Micromonospora sp. CPCC 206060]|uniref:hypothetical protein n=1 Tax=Micromonospora sp. CPCC 206060 TaxID=3122406 RepID=UPI002FF23B67
MITTTDQQTATREQVFALVAAGIGAGMPVPVGINIGDGLSHGRLEMFVRDDDPAAVELWASWLNLPAPAMVLCPMESGAHSHRSTGWFQPYEAIAHLHPDTGHQVAVKSYITVPAPADAEQVEAVAR